MIPRITEFLKINDYKIIPMHWGVRRFHSISFDGWERLTFDINDRSFTECCNVAAALLKAFVELFKDTHAFTDPELIFKFDGVVSIKIGMMDIEEYDVRIARAQNDGWE